MMKSNKSSKQLNRQVDVIRVRDNTDKPHLGVMILIKVSAPAETGRIAGHISLPRDCGWRGSKLRHRADDGKCREETKLSLRVIRPYGIKNVARVSCKLEIRISP